MSAHVRLPADSNELPFLEYWARELLDPRDPQNERWLALELGQVARGRRTADELARFVALEGASVLELGCQTGALAVALSERGAKTVGIDVDDKLVRAAELRAGCYGARAEFRVAFAETLPFADASFDLVTFIDVIEHVRSAGRALSEAARVLRPGGVLYVQGPNRFSPRWFLSDPHYRMFGISVLPEPAGRFYVTRVRRRPRYDVGVFPIGTRVISQLESLRLEVVHSPRSARDGWLTRARGEVALALGSMFVIVARKPAR